MRPAHQSPERRWTVSVVVAVVVAGTGVFAATRAATAPAGPPASPPALVAAPDAESSAWYCTGQSTASGGAVGGPLLTNTTARPVAATVDAVSDTGASAHVTLAVPARGVTAPALPALSSGSWQADTVTLAGGGVAVSQTVHGPAGWSMAPCQSTTASQWYFPGGSSSGSDGLYLSLLNPTSMPVVVDVGFETPSGAVHPINYQGIVLQPDQVQVENVSSEVQGASTVSTVVSARTGRVVAAVVQVFAGAASGLALVPGVTAPQMHWVIPQSEEVGGGASEIDVFNPGTSPEAVTVRPRLPTGPLAPLTATVAPGATWVLTSSGETRIPRGETYSTDVDATGGPGVVVGRTVVLPSTATAPQAGMALALGGLTTASPSSQWVVPPPGTPGAPAVSAAAPASLALSNASDGTARYTAVAESPTGERVLATGELAAHQSVVVSGSPLSAAGLDPIVVRADAPLAISADATPSGGVGVVTMPGIPLATPIAL